MKLPTRVVFNITDPDLKLKIWQYRKKHSILIPRIGEDALRYFFAHAGKQKKARSEGGKRE